MAEEVLYVTCISHGEPLDSPGLTEAGPRGPASVVTAPLPARDLAAIRFHYDVGEAFYGLWLDRRLTYS